MMNKLQQYFPMIRTKEEVLKEIGYTDEQIKAMEEKKAAVQIDTTQFKHLDEEM